MGVRQCQCGAPTGGVLCSDCAAARVRPNVCVICGFGRLDRPVTRRRGICPDCWHRGEPTPRAVRPHDPSWRPVGWSETPAFPAWAERLGWAARRRPRILSAGE